MQNQKLKSLLLKIDTKYLNEKEFSTISLKNKLAQGFLFGSGTNGNCDGSTNPNNGVCSNLTCNTVNMNNTTCTNDHCCAEY